jgi:predicted phage-related endonuclease
VNWSYSEPAGFTPQPQPPGFRTGPFQYYAQLQHQLEVSGAQQAHYWSFHGTDGILIETRPDPEYAKRLIEAEAAFWQLVRENRWPEVANEELDLSADPDWRHAALRYREVRLRPIS